MNPLSLSPALESAFTWTLRTSAEATVLIALVLLVQFAFRKFLSPRWVYALGVLMLLRLALPFAPASSLSIFNLARQRPTPLVALPIVAPATPPNIVVAPTTIPSPAIAPVARPSRHINFQFIAAVVWSAGCIAFLAAVFLRQRRFVRTLGRWEPVTEPRVLALLDECRSRLGGVRPITTLAAAGPGTPALFGILRPRLLLPADMLRQLDDRGLRHVFLHELVHLKRGDIPLNWAMIFLRSLHWFNPAVWLAVRKVRADQELACDAAVMARLAAAERPQYGATLIRLLEDFSASPSVPGFVPFVTNKNTIKRRITMISTFKPAGRAAVAASFVLLLALGLLTFTRAAETSTPADGPLVVTIGPAGLFHVGDAPGTTNVDELTRALRAQGRRELYLRADPNLSIERLKDLLGAARDAGMHSITLTNATVKTENVSATAAVMTYYPVTNQITVDLQPHPAENNAVVDLKAGNKGETMPEFVTRLGKEIKDQERIVATLRADLHIDDAEASFAASDSAATIATLQKTKTEAEIQMTKYQTTLNTLNRLDSEKLVQVLLYHPARFDTIHALTGKERGGISDYRKGGHTGRQQP